MTYMLANSLWIRLPSNSRIWSTHEFNDLPNLHNPRKAAAPLEKVKLNQMGYRIKIDMKAYLRPMHRILQNIVALHFDK